MGVLSIELPPQQAQVAFLEQRWRELLADPDLARFEGRIETDRHGRVVMTPPPHHNIAVCSPRGIRKH